MKNNFDERYVRTEDFASLVKGMEFAPQVWAVFAQLEQPRSVNEIASALKQPVSEVDGGVRRLLDGKLIRKEAVGWTDFAATSGSTPPLPAVASNASAKKPVSAPAAPAKPTAGAPAAKSGPATKAPTSSPAAVAPSSVPVVVSPVSAATYTPITAAAETGTPVVFLRLASTRLSKAPQAPVVALRVSRTPPPEAVTDSASGWRLRPILDAIAARAGGGVPGQLLVYKVFLQLPPDLLKAAGIHSISAVSDNFVVTQPALQKAIVDAARKHAEIDVTPPLAA